jgi:hypothetical protein
MSDRLIVAAVLGAAIPLASSTLEHLRTAKKTQKKYPAADLKSQLTETLEQLEALQRAPSLHRDDNVGQKLSELRQQVLGISRELKH